MSISDMRHAWDVPDDRSPWADPESGISFAYVTNGLDRHVIRQWRRNVSINSKAAAVGKAA